MPFQFSKDKIRVELDEALSIFRERLGRIHTGQANPALVEDIKITTQGFEMKLKELAAIRSAGPLSLVIEPWDKSSVGDIERSLLSAKSGFNPQVKGSTIYLNFSSLTQEMRETVIKEIKEIKEEARVKLRHVRDNWWEAIQKAKVEGEVREDDKFKFKDELQVIVDEYNEKIEELLQNKIKLLS